MESVFRALNASDCARRLIAGAVVLALATGTCSASADDDKQACLSSYVDAQRARRAERLLESRKAALTCARDVCPMALRQDCIAWLRDVEEATPSLVVAVIDENGHDRRDVRVFVDQREAAPAVEGGAIELDPGEHKVAIELSDKRRLEQAVVLREGERGRRLSFAFERAQPTKLERSKLERPVPPLAIGAAAFGATALVVSASLGTWGLVQRADLASCRPQCIEPIITKFHAADAALGIGVVALGLAAVLYVTRPTRASDDGRAARVRFTPLGPALEF